MEWVKQAQDMFDDWAAEQQETWAQWREVVRELNGRPTAETWRETLRVSRQALRDMEKAQARWRLQWQQGLDEAMGDPDRLAEWAQQGLAFMSKWEGAQHQMWDSWMTVFEQLSEQDTQERGSQDQAGEGLIDAWQDSVAHISQAQMDWLNRWRR